MSYELHRQPVGSSGNKIYFNSVTDPKFKHNRISVNFILPLNRETASDNAIIPFILRKGFRECPDFTSLNCRLAELYGAVLDGDVSKYGAYQVLEISIRGVDNRIALEGEDITGECAKLLASIVLDPNFDENGLFNSTDVQLERQFVVDTIEAEINDKRSYALSQCMQKMCKDEPNAVRRYGYIDTAKAITPQSATAAYHKMIKTAPVEIFFTGCGDPSGAIAVFEKSFDGLERKAFNYEKLKLRDTVTSVQEHREEMDIAQGKLVMGMRTGVRDNQQQTNAMRMFAAMYGGTPFSKLFLNVREKLSLCYYCAARFDSVTGLLMVDSGVESQNKQKAQDEIMRQLKVMQDGNFTDQEITNTKLLVKSSVTTVTDSLEGLEGWYLSQVLRQKATTPEQDAAGIDAVTREQIIEAAQKVQLDTVFFLTSPTTEDLPKEDE